MTEMIHRGTDAIIIIPIIDIIPVHVCLLIISIPVGRDHRASRQ